MSKLNPLRSFSYILSKKTITTIISLVVTPILVRLLGSSGYGDYAFVLSVINIFMIFTSAGINDGLRKFVAEDRGLSDWDNQIFAFYTKLASLLVGIGASVIILSNVGGLTQRILDPIFVVYFYLITMLLISRQFQQLFRSALMAKGLENYSEPIKVLQNIIFGASAISLTYLGYSVEGALVGHIIASISVTVLSFYYVSKNYNLRAVFTLPSKELPWRSLITFNSYNIILVLTLQSLYHIDILLLNPIVGSSATGYYKAAATISGFLWFIPLAIQQSLVHNSSEMWTTQSNSEVSDISARVTRYTMVSTILFLLGIAALANPFIPLYFGQEFTASIKPFLLLLPGTLGFAMARPIIAIGQGKGELKLMIIASAFSAIINLILNLILIPLFGIIGAAFATTIGYGSMLGLQTYSARKMGFAPLSDLRLLRVGGSVAISSTVIFGLSYLIGPNIISLSVIPPIGFIVYSISILKTRAVSPSEIINILNKGPNKYVGVFKYIVRLIE